MTRATPNNRTPQTLFVALELSKATWVVAATDRNGVDVVITRIDAGRFDVLEQFFAKRRRKLGLRGDAPVRSCYEAGRDGFWVHRALAERGIENLVLDPASIEMPRRMRRAKTDRLDAGKLLQLLLRLSRGEKAAQIVRVPTPEQEDRRQTLRERDRLKSLLTSTTNHIGGLLAAQGVMVQGASVTREKLASLRLWNGEQLPGSLRRRLERAVESAARLREQVKAVDRELREVFNASLAREQVASDEGRAVPIDNAVMLHQLVGIGRQGALLLSRELFDWRDFQNRRQVGAFTGLVSVPQLSGAGGREEGISKAGSARVRKLLVEQAWSWLRNQPSSALSTWFHERFGKSKRSRRVGIVALARKLAVAMWRYLKDGVVPEGALMRTM